MLLNFSLLILSYLLPVPFTSDCRLSDRALSCLYSSVPPKIDRFDFGGSAIFAGEAAQVTCLVTQGDSPLEIGWEFQNSRVFPVGVTTTRVGSRASLLLIEATGPDHQGTYTCIAKNPVGIVRYSATLEIHGNVKLKLALLQFVSPQAIKTRLSLFLFKFFISFFPG